MARGSIPPEPMFSDNLDEEGNHKTKEPLYYSLKPFYGRTGGIASAALVNCIATGKPLDSMGGPGYAIAPEIVAALDRHKNGGKLRMIVDQDKWDGLLSTLDSVANALQFGGVAELTRLQSDVEQALEYARSDR